jgi:hypothetical protein
VGCAHGRCCCSCSSVKRDLRASPLAELARSGRSGSWQGGRVVVESCFAHVEEQALAAASIAQVGAARGGGCGCGCGFAGSGRAAMAAICLAAWAIPAALAIPAASRS